LGEDGINQGMEIDQ